MRGEKAEALMMRFAERTGLTSQRDGERYLWTDAFAVDNFLGLAREKGAARYVDLAIVLVDRVHRTLGRYRSGDSRTGWISGLDERLGGAHPTRGGLRIGKPLPERRPDEAFDERLEWDRDGQYFHYLTQWMHALDRLSEVTGKPIYNEWARELADRAFRAFTFTVPGARARRMYWKMSIDLSRPLVRSMGQQDPLDGYVTYAELRATAARLKTEGALPDIGGEVGEFESMLESAHLVTTDPLGLGGLLIAAFRVDRLLRSHTISWPDLLPRLLSSALAGLEQYVDEGETSRPASSRLAFRELGLAIGLHAVALMGDPANGDTQTRQHLARLARFVPLAEAIESFWLDPGHQKADTWLEHLDINEVMLATSLSPAGFLGAGDDRSK